MHNPAYIKRLNAFLEKYAKLCEDRGDFLKAHLVRSQSIPSWPKLY
jgi:hypothetical protein